jgi:hypothetical protein
VAPGSSDAPDPPPGGWLPPEPPGGGDAYWPPAGQPAPPPAQPGRTPPSGYPVQGAAPPRPAQPPPGQHPPYGQRSPYGQQSPYGQGSPWAATYYTYAEPDNSPAVAGFIVAITSVGLLLVSFGFLAPITLIGSTVSIFVSRNGIKKVERGETNKNKDLARWGFWLGIVGVVFATLAIAVWIAVIASDPDFFDEDPTPRERGEPVEALALVVRAAARAAGALLG